MGLVQVSKKDGSNAKQKKAMLFTGHPGHLIADKFPRCLYDCHMSADYSGAGVAFNNYEVCPFSSCSPKSWCS